MSVQLPMFLPPTWTDSSSAISSQELAGGALPPALLDGQTTENYGPAPRLASLTVLRALLTEAQSAKQTNATCRLNLSDSSGQSGLASSMASRLRARLHGAGSTIFSPIWKTKATPRRRSYCQLLLSARTMKEKGFTGWPTPAARDGRDISRSNAFLSQRERHSPSMATCLLTQGAHWTVITAIYCLAMGYPSQWNDARPRVTETQLSRNSRPKS